MVNNGKTSQRKRSGWNLSLDDINVGTPLAKPEAEINAIIDTDTIFSGGSYYTGETIANTKRINVIIQNQGTDSTLKITNVTSSNPDFVVTNTSLNIPFLSSDTISNVVPPDVLQLTHVGTICINFCFFSFASIKLFYLWTLCKNN